MPPKSRPSPFPRAPRRRGAALVVALGLLSLVLLLALAFVAAMQTERMAARNARARTVGRQFSSIAPFSAFSFLNSTNFIPHVYWADESDDEQSAPETNDVIARVYGSGNATQRSAAVRGLLVGSDGTELDGQKAVFHGPEDDGSRFATLPAAATNFLPTALLHVLETNALPLRWQYITSRNESDPDDLRLAGRVTFLAADLSGQADIHHLSPAQWRMADIAKEDIEPLLTAITNAAPLANRPDLLAFLQQRFSTLPDDPVLDAIGTLSLDPDPFQLPYGAPIGDTGLLVTNKFDLASLTNNAEGLRLVRENSPSDDPRRRWQEAADEEDDVRDYLSSVSNALYRIRPLFTSGASLSNKTARAVFWNLLNDLDADRYPQTDSEDPWLDDYGVEDLPLLSELVLEEVDDTPGEDADDAPSATTADAPTPLEGLVDDCPACQRLRKATLSAPAYRGGAELWYAFHSVTNIPQTWLAQHLYAISYTNDAENVAARVGQNIDKFVDGSVTELIETYWSTNVVRRTYQHAETTTIDLPPLSFDILEYGIAGATGNIGNTAPTNLVYLAAGEVDNPTGLELAETNTVYLTVHHDIIDIVTETNFVVNVETNIVEGMEGVETNIVEVSTTNTVETVTTNMSVRAAAYTITTNTPPSHFYDALLGYDPVTGDRDPSPLGSLLDGDYLLRYLVSTNIVEMELGEDEYFEETNLVYTSAFYFEPHATITNSWEGERTTVLSNVVTTVTATNLFGEVSGTLTTAPETPVTRAILDALPTLLRTEPGSSHSFTNWNDATRYEIEVFRNVTRIGADTRKGGGDIWSLLTNGDGTTNAIAAWVGTVTNFVDRTDYDSTYHRFAAARTTPFRFEVPCEHVFYDTDSTTVLESHSISVPMPIGFGYRTNAVYILTNDLDTASSDFWADFDPENFQELEVPLPVENTVLLSAQVFLEDPCLDSATGVPHEGRSGLSRYPVDEAPGPGSDTNLVSRTGTDNDIEAPWFLETDRPLACSVEDPRFNGRTYRWRDETETLGAPSALFADALEDGASASAGDSGAESLSLAEKYPCFQGYPLLHHDGLPAHIGDIGYLGTDEPWESLDLLAPSGAKLLDLWCLAPPDGTNAPRRAFGRIHAQTPFPAAAAFLFADTAFGPHRLDTDPDSDTHLFVDLLDSDPDTAEKLLRHLTNAVIAAAHEFHPVSTNSLALSHLFFDSADTEPTQDRDLDDAVFPIAQWFDCLVPHLLSKEGVEMDEPGSPSIVKTAEGSASKIKMAELCSAFDVEMDDLRSAFGAEMAGEETADLRSASYIPGLDLFEDLLRDLPDRVTFRQNLVLVVARSDALAPNGRVESATRTVYLLFRDSWTGAWNVVDELELR